MMAVDIIMGFIAGVLVGWLARGALTMQDDIKPVLTNEQLDAIHAAMQNYAACNINVFHFIARDVESEVLRVLADRDGRQPIPVDVRLPDLDDNDGWPSSARVLAWWPQDEGGEIVEGWCVSFLQDGGTWQHACGSNDYHLGVRPTHWMPLPAPPAGAQRAKEDV